MNFEGFKKIIKSGNLGKLYHFEGEESFLIDNCLALLYKKVVDEQMADFNYFVFTDRNLSLQAASDAIEAYPVLADKKLIVFKNAGLFSSADKDGFAQLFSNVPDYACVIVCESGDKRSKLYKFLSANGENVLFNFLGRSDLKSLITSKLSKSGKSMSDNDVAYIIETCGPEMNKIKIELEKLISYTGEKTEISRKDIDKLIVPPLSDRVFEMADAIVSKNGSAAFSVLSDLKALRESPVKILSIIAGTFTDMYRACLLNKADMSYNDKLDAMKLPPNRRFVAEKLLRKASSVDADFVRKTISLLRKADDDIKMGRMNDWAALEMVVCSCI